MIRLENAVLTDHALAQMASRGITSEHVEAVIIRPEDVIQVRQGRVVAQRVLESGMPAKGYLFRVFVDIDRNPPQVVTVYRTSKIEKYRRT